VPLGLPAPDDLLQRIRSDVERAGMRARNGIRHVAGVGRPELGGTPKDVVWKAGRAELWRYRTDRVEYDPPVFIVNSLIGRSTILDLTEKSSLVRSFLGAGHEVFMLDWGVADERDSRNTLETYVDDYMHSAVTAASNLSGSNGVNLFGYCLGGVLSTLLTARYPELPIRSLTALATPIDSDAMGLLYDLVRDGKIDPAALIDETGNVPPEVVRRAFTLLKPTSEVVKYVNLWENLWNDEFVASYQAMAQWLGDPVPFPGATFLQIVQMLIRDNAFMHDAIRLGGQSVHLRDIRCPFLNVTAERDEIVPPAAARPLLHLVGSVDKEELSLNAAHVGVIAGRTASRVTVPTIIEFLSKRSTPRP